jgi:dTDP-4-amino-4,6-dideoxygalactose transaminase
MSQPGTGPARERGPESPQGGWRVPFVRPDVPEFSAVAADFEAAISSGLLTKGPQLQRLEEEAAAALGVRHVVGVSSCTLGLTLVLESLAEVRHRRATGCPAAGRCPLPAGGAESDRHEVILPSFNFLAAPAAVVWAGFDPVFVDVDPDTFTIDPAAVAAALTPHTAAIMACHTFGCPCDLRALEAIAGRAGVPLVVDAAHGLGTLSGGRHVGAGGLAQVFSLSPTKLVVAGEGGLVATDCDCLADLVRIAREYGNDGQYGCRIPGLNARLPELSAILARSSLARLGDVSARRREAAAAYVETLADLPGIGFQAIPPGATSSWKDFSISVDPGRAALGRDALRSRLAAAGIDTRAYYSPACHQMEAFRGHLRPGTRLPVTERLAATLLSLPMGAHVPPDVARWIGREIRAALGHATIDPALPASVS